MAEDDKPPKRSTAGDDDILKEDKEAFEQARDAEDHNRITYEEDVKFSRLEEQWGDTERIQRENDRVPTLTINKLGAFIKQVVNDSRQNKPSMKAHPVDDKADVETAKVIGGLLRNIEAMSGADMAYDWAIDCAASGGFGYWRIVDEYAHDDTFDMDLLIKRVLDPLSVYGDPHATEADGSDWNSAFIVNRMRRDDFKKKYKGAATVDWDALGYTDKLGDWYQDEEVLVAERWIRDEVDRPICLLSDGSIIGKDKMDEVTEVVVEGVTYSLPNRDRFIAEGITVLKERITKSWKVTQRILTGAEVLETKEWKGRHIPIIPVYGEEVYLKGKRYFRSLIRSAKGAQQQFNFWESNATELAAMQPRVPFIGEQGAFDIDSHKWGTPWKRWPYLEHKRGLPKPERQPIDMGPAAASLSEAARASENIKSTLGMYGDATRQTLSPESGRALNARKREEDVATFHFSDNVSRAIRYTGRQLLDLVPHYYSERRIIRVLGEDGAPEIVPLKTPTPVKDPQGKPVMQEVVQPGPDGQPLKQQVPMTRIIDPTKGKYDIIVSPGQSFATRREEAATQMTEMVRAMPDAGPIIMPILAKNLDWPGAEELAEAFKAIAPPGANGPSPEMQQMQQQAKEAIDQLTGQIKKLTEENQQLKVQGQQEKLSAQQQQINAAGQILQVKGQLQAEQNDKTIERLNLLIEDFRAHTERMEAMKPDPKPAERPAVQ